MAFLFFTMLAAGGKNLLSAESKTVPFSLETGVKLELEGLGAKEELSLSQKLTLPFLQVKLAEKPEDRLYNYGLIFNTQKLTPKVPLILMAGKLTAGGSLSKMNSPELSQTVYAGVSPPKINLLKASIASSNVFTKPDALFTRIGYANKSGLMRKTDINAFYDGNTITSSLDFEFKLRDLKTQINFTGGLYPYAAKKENSWFYSTPFYHQGNHFAGLGQIELSYKKFDSLFLINLYESPFGKILYTYRTESYFAFRHFAFNFAGFLNLNENLLTSSEKALSPLLQLKGGGQYQFVTGKDSPLFVKTAFSAQADIHLDDNQHSLKTAGSIKITGEKTNISLITKINLGAKDENQNLAVDFTSGNIEATLSRFIYCFKPQVKAKFTFEPDSKKEKWILTEKITLSCTWYDKSGIINIGSDATASFIQKNGENKESYSAGVYVKLKLNWFSLKVDVGI